MKNKITRHNRIGSFLLVLYLMILAVGVLHIHECEENASVCQDCIEHVNHNAHISQASFMSLECVLCKIIHSDYITPEVLMYSAAVLLFVSVATCAIENVMRRAVVLPSLRAPPVMGF